MVNNQDFEEQELDNNGGFNDRWSFLKNGISRGVIIF